MPPLHTEVDLGLGAAGESSDAAMADFEAKASSIDRDAAGAERSLKKVNKLLASRASTATLSPQMDALETEVSLIRSQLAALAEANKQAGGRGGQGPASIRIRVTRFQKMASDFTAFLRRFEETRDRYREMLGKGIREDVTGLGLGLSERQVDSALEQEAQMEDVLTKASPELRYQVEDLRARNKALAKVNKDMAQLHAMFVELSYLTETQQSLINDIEHNVELVQTDVQKADEEIVEARRYQKSVKKKKIIVAVILLLALAGLIIFLVVQFT